MKRVDQYSDDELLALNDEELGHLVAIEVAYVGIIPVRKPELEEPIKPELEKTEKFIKVGDYLVKDMAEAQKFMDIKLYTSEYDWSGAGSDYPYPKTAALDVQETMLYSKVAVKKLEDDLKSYKKLKEAYDSAWRAYRKYNDETEGCQNEVWGRLQKIRDDQYKFETLKVEAERFLVLSEGNINVAKTFFEKAYGEDECAAMVVEAVYSEKE